MSFPRDIKDRIVQNPSRYQLIKVEGTLDQYDLVPVPGTITEEGTAVNKAYLQPIEDELDGLKATAEAALPKAGGRMDDKIEFENADNWIGNVGDQMVVRSNTVARLEGKDLSRMSVNAYHDGSTWNRFDITKSAMLLDLNGPGNIFQIYRAAAGANPIAWGPPAVIWDSSLDGPGSGLDADSVDGIHAIDFGRIYNKGEGTNLNTCIDNGFYRLAGALVNGAPGTDFSYCTMIVSRGGDTVFQMLVQYSTAATWVRSGNPPDVGGNGSWTSWKQLMSSDGNMTVGNQQIGFIGLKGTGYIPYVQFSKWAGGGTGYYHNAIQSGNTGDFEIYTSPERNLGEEFFTKRMHISNGGELTEFHTNFVQAKKYITTIGTTGSIAGNAGGSAAKYEVLAAPGEGNAAFMEFHRPGHYAGYFGIDSDNQWKVGGWSMGPNAFTIWHSGNSPLPAQSAYGTYAGNDDQDGQGRLISVGFIPSMLIVYMSTSGTNAFNNGNFAVINVASGGYYTNGDVTINMSANNGFRVYSLGPNARLNRTGHNYNWLAWRIV